MRIMACQPQPWVASPMIGVADVFEVAAQLDGGGRCAGQRQQGVAACWGSVPATGKFHVASR